MVELEGCGSNPGFIQDIFSLSLYTNPAMKLIVLRHDKKAITHDDKTRLRLLHP